MTNECKTIDTKTVLPICKNMLSQMDITHLLYYGYPIMWKQTAQQNCLDAYIIR